MLVLAATAGAKRQGDELLDTSSAGVAVNLPGGQDLPALEGLPQCSNEIDDDGTATPTTATPSATAPSTTPSSSPARSPPPMTHR